MKRSFGVVAAALVAVPLFASQAQAGLITFDQAITGTLAPDDPNDPVDNCIVLCVYDATPGNEGIFSTQGFTFTVLPSSGGDHGEGIVINADLLPEVPQNGTDWMLAGGLVQMRQTDNSAFALKSFQAALVVDDDTSGRFVRALGFKNGVGFAVLHFEVTSSFQTFVLPATWTGLSSVNFSGRFTAADGSPRIMAVDNIAFEAVPEPASLVLFGTGLVGALAATRLRRAKRQPQI